MRGAYYPEGGGQTLAAGLLEVIRAHGGALRTYSRVSRITVGDGRARGVELADGWRALAPVVVSNADYRRTMLGLVGEERLPRRLAAKTRDARMALPWASVYVALDIDIEQHANLWWYRSDDIEGFYAGLRAGADTASGGTGTADFLFASFASGKDPVTPRICPPGHSNFQLMTLCPPGFERWGVTAGPADGEKYRRNPVYQAEKARLTEAVLDAAEEALGPFRSHITHLETATPLTHERYTHSTGGTPFGMAHWGAAGARPDTATFVEGLYVAGANTRYGNGITGSAVSGIACAGRILGRRLMHEVHNGATLGDPAALPERRADWDPLEVSRGDEDRLVRTGPGLVPPWRRADEPDSESGRRHRRHQWHRPGGHPRARRQRPPGLPVRAHRPHRRGHGQGAPGGGSGRGRDGGRRPRPRRHPARGTARRRPLRPGRRPGEQRGPPRRRQHRGAHGRAVARRDRHQSQQRLPDDPRGAHRRRHARQEARPDHQHRLHRRRRGDVLDAPHSASKHGVIGFTKALGNELAPTGITVNAVCPGHVETPTGRRIRQEYAAAYGIGEEVALKTFQSKIPLGRYSTPAEVAGLVGYLTTDTAASITAQALNVCGGLGAS